MDNDIKDDFVATKIEIDGDTNEPKIVKLNQEEYKKEIDKQDPTLIEKKMAESTRAKQVVMNKVFGMTDDKSISRRQKFLKNFVSTVFIVLVVIILAYTFYNDFFGSEKPMAPWKDIRDTLIKNWYYFFFAVTAFALTLVFKGAKLSILCKTITKKFYFKVCFETGVIGSYYNNVTPLAVGGQPFEIYHLTKHGIHGGAAASLPIVSFFLNQIAFVVLSILSITLLEFNTFGFTQSLPVVIKSLSIIGIVLCMTVPSMVIVFSMMPRFCGGIIKFISNIGARFRIIKSAKNTTYKTMKNVMHNSRCIKKIATSPIGFTVSILLSFCEQLANASIAYFTLRFFGFDLPEGGFIEWLIVCQLCFILYSAISFIPTPGNSGAADISFYTLFSAGIEVAGLAFPALMVWRLLSFYSIIIIGLIFVNSRKRRERRLSQNQREFL